MKGERCEGPWCDFWWLAPNGARFNQPPCIVLHCMGCIALYCMRCILLYCMQLIVLYCMYCVLLYCMESMPWLVLHEAHFNQHPADYFGGLAGDRRTGCAVFGSLLHCICIVFFGFYWTVFQPRCIEMYFLNSVEMCFTPVSWNALKSNWVGLGTYNELHFQDSALLHLTAATLGSLKDGLKHVFGSFSKRIFLLMIKNMKSFLKSGAVTAVRL